MSANAATNSSELDYRALVESGLGLPFTEGNQVDVLRNGEQIFPAMLDAIGAAETSIEFLTFVYWRGDIAEKMAEALSERASAGVTVRILLDAVGAGRMRKTLVRQMQESGCEVEWFRPLHWRTPTKYLRRTHRKVLVCDRQVAFSGGVGVAKQWEGDARNADEWRDTHFRVRGPAVNSLFAGFLHNWNETHGSWDDRWLEPVRQPCPGKAAIATINSASTYGWSDVATLGQLLLRAVRRELLICTAYFQPDAPTRALLTAAADRGVDVTVLIPSLAHTDEKLAHHSTHRHLAELLAAGVTVQEFQPTMIHNKTLLFDGQIAVVGSPNFNQRSIRHDEEILLGVVEPETVGALRDDFFADLARSKALKLRDWEQRGRLKRLVERFASLMQREM